MEISTKKSRHEERDYLRVARTLRDKLDGLITSGTTDLGTQRKILLDVSQESTLILANNATLLANNATHRYDEISTCTHSCCEHEQIMNPGLWSTLPMELLQRVFAKLPFSNICRLKSLSKEWQLSLQSSSSEFTVALKESSPRMLARVSSAGRSNFLLHVFDGRNNRWHELLVNIVASSNAQFRLNGHSGLQCWVHMNGAADAGLVCYVYRDLETGFNNIYVINPMTGVVNQLPGLNVLKYSNLSMMRIIVDRNTLHYKVIVVKRAAPVEAEVYDSTVQQWTKPDPSLGRIFGIAHGWRLHDGWGWKAHKVGPCVYDFRDGKYHDFRQDREKWLGEKVMSCTLMKDRLFVLYWDQEEFTAFISEYSVPDNATSWVKMETHSCFPRFFEKTGVTGLTSRIHSCSGLLFVFILKVQENARGPFDYVDHKKYEYGWVFNLATRKWCALPRVPWGSNAHFQCSPVTNAVFVQSPSFMTNVMCELHWSIRP